jgi:hypothetical protein
MNYLLKNSYQFISREERDVSVAIRYTVDRNGLVVMLQTSSPDSTDKTDKEEEKNIESKFDADSVGEGN